MLICCPHRSSHLVHITRYATDREPLVQLAFATCLSQIASVAKRFLDKSFASQLNEPTSTGSASASSAAAAEGVGDTLGDSLNAAAAAATSRLNYFQQLENLHDGVKKMIQVRSTQLARTINERFGRHEWVFLLSVILST